MTTQTDHWALTCAHLVRIMTAPPIPDPPWAREPAVAVCVRAESAFGGAHQVWTAELPRGEVPVWLLTAAPDIAVWVGLPIPRLREALAIAGRHLLNSGPVGRLRVGTRVEITLA
jgi:hypothetical protein